MINVVQQHYDADINSVFVSDPFVLVDLPIGQHVVNIVGGSLYVNGTLTTTPTNITNTDTLYVKITNSSSYSTTTYAILDVNGSKYIISSTTNEGDTTIVLLDAAHVNPLDYLTFPDDTVVTPSSTANNVMVNLSNDTQLVKYFREYPFPQDVYPSDVTKDLIYVCDYYDDKIFIFKLENEELSVIGRITLPTGSHPYGALQLIDQQLVVVSCAGTDSVIYINRIDGNIVDTVPVGNRPMGLTTSNNVIWVANYEDNTVTKITPQLTTTSYNVGPGPLDLIVTSTNEVWIANSKTNTISILNPTTGSVEYITVGSDPWGLCEYNGYVYVTNSFDFTVSKINVLTKLVQTTYDVGTFPYSILVHENELYINSYGNRTIEKYDLNFNLLETTPSSYYPYGMFIDPDDNIWVVNMYSNIPERFKTLDVVAGCMFFNKVEDASLNTVYTSNEVTVSHVDTEPQLEISVSIPAIVGTSIYKNNVDVGFQTTVVNGDKLYLKATSSSNYGQSIQVPLSVGVNTYTFEIVTEAWDDIVHSYHFNTITNATINTQYTSNLVTISGITTGINVPITTSSGSLIINGVDVGQVGTVSNGSTVRVKNTSSVINTVVSSIVDINGHIDVFSISTSTVNYFSSAPTISFTELFDVPTNTVITSNAVTISRLIFSLDLDDKPLPSNTPISIDPYPNTYIIKNNVNVGYSTTINNGDTVKIATTTAAFTGAIRTVNLYVGSYKFPWVVHNIHTLPRPLNFYHLVDVEVGTTYLSNVVTVKDLDPDDEVTVYVPHGTLYVNGITSNKIKLNDTVQWEVVTKGPYGGHLREYKLSLGGTSLTTGVISTWNMCSMYLDKPIHATTSSVGLTDAKDYSFFYKKHTTVKSAVQNFVRQVRCKHTVVEPQEFVFKTNTNIIKGSTLTFKFASTKNLIKSSASIYQRQKSCNIRPFDKEFVTLTNKKSNSFEHEFTVLTNKKPISFEKDFVLLTNKHVSSSDYLFSQVKSCNIIPVEQEFVVLTNKHLSSSDYLFSQVKSCNIIPVEQEFVTSTNKNSNSFEHIFSHVKSCNIIPVEQEYIKLNRPVLTVEQEYININRPVLTVEQEYVKLNKPVLTIQQRYYKYNKPLVVNEQAGVVYISKCRNVLSVDTGYGISSSSYFGSQLPFFGTFDTGVEAIQAGNDLGYAGVTSYQLPNGKYVWVTTNIDCSYTPPPLPTDFAFGYKHGG